MTEYQIPGEAEAIASVERTFSTSLGQLDKALELGVMLLQKSDSFTTTHKVSDRTGLVVLGLYMKALKTVRAIRLAVTRDLVEDGLVLCRTLLETGVAIVYILQKKTPRRANEYLAALLMRRRWNLEDWQKTRGLKSMGKRYQKANDKRLVPYEKTLGKARLEELRRGYSGMKIKRTFDALRMGKQYVVEYAFLSNYQHAADLPDHVEIAPDKAIQLKMGSSEAWKVRLLLELTQTYFCGIMESVSGAMKLGYEADIVALHPRSRAQVQRRVEAWWQRMKARRAKPGTP